MSCTAADSPMWRPRPLRWGDVGSSSPRSLRCFSASWAAGMAWRVMGFDVWHSCTDEHTQSTRRAARLIGSSPRTRLQEARWLVASHTLQGGECSTLRSKHTKTRHATPGCSWGWLPLELSSAHRQRTAAHHRLSRPSPAPCLNRSSAASGCFNTRVNQQHLPAGALGFAPACSGPPLLRVRSFRGLGCWQMRFKCGWTASDTFPVRWADVAGAVARRRCRRGADFTHCSRQYTHRITTCTAEAGVIVSVSSQRKAQEPNRRRMDGMQPLPGSPLLGASCGAAASPVPSCCRCCLRRCRRWPALMAAR